MSTRRLNYNAFRACSLMPEQLEGMYRRVFEHTIQVEGCTCCTLLARDFPVVFGYGKRYTASHIVLIAEGRLPRYEYHQASHRCGNRYCVTPDHLRWELPHENLARDLCHKHGHYDECPHTDPCLPTPQHAREAVYAVYNARPRRLLKEPTTIT